MRRNRSSLVLIVGASLLALGLGNTALGAYKLRDYGGRMEAAVAASGPAVRKPARGTWSILDPANDEQLQYEDSLLKFEYYQVVFRGGLLLLGLGGLLIGGVAVRALLVRVRGARDGFALRQS